MNEKRYPWIAEASKILLAIVPCSRNEACASLIEQLTWRAVDVATRGTGNRRAAANTAIFHLLSSGKFTEDNGCIYRPKSQRPQIGVSLLESLKRDGRVSVTDTGFTASSARTYKGCLRKLGWISVDNDTWIWCGPGSAEWSEVEKSRKNRQI